MVVVNLKGKAPRRLKSQTCVRFDQLNWLLHLFNMVIKCRQWVQLQDLKGHPMWKCGSDVPEENESAVNIIQSYGPVLLL